MKINKRDLITPANTTDRAFMAKYGIHRQALQTFVKREFDVSLGEMGEAWIEEAVEYYIKNHSRKEVQRKNKIMAHGISYNGFYCWLRNNFGLNLGDCTDDFLQKKIKEYRAYKRSLIAAQQLLEKAGKHRKLFTAWLRKRKCSVYKLSIEERDSLFKQFLGEIKNAA